MVPILVPRPFGFLWFDCRSHLMGSVPVLGLHDSELTGVPAV